MSTTSAFVGSIPETYHSALGLSCSSPSLASWSRGRCSVPGTAFWSWHAARGSPREAMLELARRHVASDPRIHFQQADACALPFADGSFDLLLCQFSVMFFPDKLRAMREAKRALAPGARYVFSVWDSLEHNPQPRVVHETLARLFPADPPTFLSTPYGWFDRATIEHTLRAAGFTEIRVDVVTLPAVAASSDDVARGFLEGTPMLGQLRERGVADVAPVRKAVSEALGGRYGQRPCRATMRASVVTAA